MTRSAKPTHEPKCEVHGCYSVAGFHTTTGRDLCGKHWREDADGIRILGLKGRAAA